MESISMFDININSESFEGGFSDNYKCKFNNACLKNMSILTK